MATRTYHELNVTDIIGNEGSALTLTENTTGIALNSQNSVNLTSGENSSISSGALLTLQATSNAELKSTGGNALVTATTGNAIVSGTNASLNATTGNVDVASVAGNVNVTTGNGKLTLQSGGPGSVSILGSGGVEATATTGNVALTSAVGDVNLASTKQAINITGATTATVTATTGNTSLVATAGEAVVSSGGAVRLVAGTEVVSTKNINMSNTGRIINLMEPVNDNDAATRAWTLQVSAGLIPKASCQLATTMPLTVNTYNNGVDGKGATLTFVAGPIVIDGVTVDKVNTPRVLIKNEPFSEPSKGNIANGIYDVTSDGKAGGPVILTRSTDADTPIELAGADTFITGGDTNVRSGFVCITPHTMVIGTTEIVFSINSSSAQIKTAPNSGLIVTNGAVDTSLDTSLVVLPGNNLAVNTGSHTFAGQSAFALPFEVRGATIKLGDTGITTNVALISRDTINATASTTITASATDGITLVSNADNAKNNTITINANNTGTGDASITTSADNTIVTSKKQLTLTQPQTTWIPVAPYVSRIRTETAFFGGDATNSAQVNMFALPIVATVQGSVAVHCEIVVYNASTQLESSSFVTNGLYAINATQQVARQGLLDILGIRPRSWNIRDSLVQAGTFQALPINMVLIKASATALTLRWHATVTATYST